MNGTDLNYFRSCLLLQKSRILNRSVEFRDEQMRDPESLIEETDKISLEQATSMSIQLHERDRSSLMMIERALGKIDDGTYGQCESCGEYIHSKRLQVSPFAVMCVACLEEQEQSPRLQ